MATIPTGLAVNTSVPGDRTTASGFRKILAALFAQSAAGVPVPGIIELAGLTPLDVVPHATLMKYTVLAGFAVTTRTSQGAYVVGHILDTELTVPAGDGSNPRIDRIFIVQPDAELAESGVARIDVAVGTPGASPALPAIPTGALELKRKLVPSGAANTTTGTAMTNKAVYTGLSIAASQIGGLSALLSGKADTVHTHLSSQITDLATAGNAYKTGGKRWISQATGSGTPAGLSVGDVVVEYTP